MKLQPRTSYAVVLASSLVLVVGGDSSTPLVGQSIDEGRPRAIEQKSPVGDRRAETRRADGEAYPRSGENPKLKRIQELLDSLAPENLSGKMTLEECVRKIRAETVSTVLPDGIPFYVNPEGLRDTHSDMTSLIVLDPEDGALRTVLRRALKPLGLGFVAGDLVEISSFEGLAPIAVDGEPASNIVLDRLGWSHRGRWPHDVDRDAAFYLANEPDAEILGVSGETMEQFLERLRRVTSDAHFPGIPTQIDADGFREAGRRLSDIRPVYGRTLLITLRRTLKPTGLGFAVKNGVLIISSREAIEQLHRESAHARYLRPVRSF
jgi:hypothetical protein